METENQDIDTMSIFESGKIFAANDDILFQILNQMCTKAIPNEMVRHREIIRGITINHILLKRYIDKLNNNNRKMQFLLIILTVAILITSGIQIYLMLLR